MLTHGPRARSTGRPSYVRRAALTIAVAVALVLAAEALPTLRPPAPHTNHAPHPRKAAINQPPYGGEPQPSRDGTAPRAPRAAAVRFVRDYAAWQARRLASLPSHDATERVVRLLERAGRHGPGVSMEVTHSVRMAASGERRYVVTSALGNFSIGRRGPRWLVVSLPGD